MSEPPFPDDLTESAGTFLQGRQTPDAWEDAQAHHLAALNFAEGAMILTAGALMLGAIGTGFLCIVPAAAALVTAGAAWQSKEAAAEDDRRIRDRHEPTALMPEVSKPKTQVSEAQPDGMLAEAAPTPLRLTA